ncbi:A disintegrin and metalloproteinase with thrombospondin motifs 6-like isoform X3 [Pomacea canaliculata]|nr:A disintegrin and metalloproteinase with thrombospondin motifs 6-like isoform X3 [Pomacea canaliculata]
MCESGRSCNINEDIGLASAFIIAHEIGHNFGMHHDGAGNTCGLPDYEPARIMAARLTKDTSPFQWSSCSQRYVTDFLDAGRGWCLDNIPLKREAYPKDLPGERLDMDVQCQHQFFHLSRACKLKKACRELWCVNSAGECTTNSVPAAEGTECYMSRHKKGWCFQGECRNPQYEPQTVDGSWGQWGAWGECSRTCSGGVEASERDCDDPKPQDGGRYCVGQRKRYRSCHVTPCPPEARDFREVQCSSYDKVPFRGHYYKWVPYTGEQAKPCALVCMAEGYNFYTERVSKVIDGTRCYPDKPHICINGECKFVGCDGYLGSRKKEDVCRVCDGDNSTCKTVSGIFDKPLPNGAYQEVVTIPKGAVYVQISEASFSTNYLALKDVKDKYYINGDWTIDWPRKFTVAGTVFHYKLSGQRAGVLQALGPTSEDLVVMMLLQEGNRGIQYQYNLPINTSSTLHDISLYTWRHSPWFPCTKSCSTGVSISKAECVNKSDGRTVNDTYCHPQPRPRDHMKQCNQQACPPDDMRCCVARWSVGEWLECSRTCGEGVRTRLVACVQVGGDGERVVQDESECEKGSKPPTQEDCLLQRCPAIWHTFEWSECAPSCGPGERTRRVVCMTSDSDSYLDERQCEESGEVKPAARQTCVSRRCPPPQWRKGEWGQCSVSCGSGTQERTVQCQSFSGDPCDPALRPPAVRECQSMCSDEEEIESNCEDKFKVAYCPLVFNFGYCERPYFQTMCCQTCTKGGAPPSMPATSVRKG